MAEALFAQRIGHERFDRLEPALLGDFLPDWADDWVLIEREKRAYVTSLRPPEVGVRSTFNVDHLLASW
ncbi:MAG: hypothetical protein ACR2G2_04360 [Pseudonocardia sp.]